MSLPHPGQVLGHRLQDFLQTFARKPKLHQVRPARRHSEAYSLLSEQHFSHLKNVQSLLVNLRVLVPATYSTIGRLIPTYLCRNQLWWYF